MRGGAVARAEGRRRGRGGASRRGWWLAAPALVLAAWAAFSATLALIGDERPLAPAVDVRLSARVDGQRALAPAPPGVPPVATAPLVLPAEASSAAAAGASPGDLPAVVPASPTATPASRAAADGAAVRKVKPKRAPKESLTEQDRRALDALVEQAGKNAR